MTSKKYLKNVPLFQSLETAEQYGYPEKRKPRHKRIIPVRKFCQECQVKRVKYHHHLCTSCWLKIHYPKKEVEFNENFEKEKREENNESNVVEEREKISQEIIQRKITTLEGGS